MSLQAAGWIQQWNGTDFTFLTFKRAGHNVPKDAPSAALSAFAAFLSGNYSALLSDATLYPTPELDVEVT